MIQNKNLHYGWFIVLAGMLCIFGCIGLGRFALGMLLPAMGISLNLSYSQMGLISTSNFIGYLLSVLLCGHLAARFGSRQLIFAALLLSGISMMLISTTSNLYAIILLYLLTGMGSGASNVPMMGLVSQWFVNKHRGKAAGLIVSGSGFAILLSGKLIPFLNQLSDYGWRLSWFSLGVVVVVIAVICVLILRNSPKEFGLLPVGTQKIAGNSIISNNTPISTEHNSLPKIIYHCAAIYFLFGYTYVIYATFIVTTMVQERGFSEDTAGDLWSWVGVLSLLSGPVFGTLSDRLGRKTGLIIVFFIQTIAYLLVALNLPDAFLYLSIGCYGVVAWSIPTIMTALVGDYAGPGKAVKVLGFVTFIFAIGQIVGPYLAGLLAEASGSFSSSFLMSAIMTGIAVLLSVLLKEKLS
ncbi:MAG: YbfB/YjiJ family MFS transporter [SAR324 cluster bacterium]|nr:YbfB/YjiJ family MFS transporter [SAR324 cluster bacterium]